MTTKICIKVGGVEVDYEGPEAFLDSKLHKLISEVAALAKQAPAKREDGPSSGNTRSETSSTLVSFLKEKKVFNQTQRFLATAEWLHQKGLDHIQTAHITKALQDHKQKKLSNPSDCLRQNVAKGYCQKVGKEFYVTDEGRNSLG